MLQALKRLIQEKDAIGYSEIEASLFTASPINTTWTLSPEIISLLALLQTGISVRILDTSRPSEEEHQSTPSGRG